MFELSYKGRVIKIDEDEEYLLFVIEYLVNIHSGQYLTECFILKEIKNGN